MRETTGTFLKQLLQPRMMLYIWGGIGLLALVWISGSAMIPQGKPAPENREVRNLLTGAMRDFEPAFPPRGATTVMFKGPEGEASLRDFRGKVVLVNVWATWCGPCIEELPSLDRLHQSFDRRDFEVVAIAAEPRVEERARAFFDRLGISALDIYTDETLRFATGLGGTGALPISVLYDQKGNEIGRLLGGADWSSPEAKALIQAVIDGRDVS